jgi:hypothetical protein
MSKYVVQINSNLHTFIHLFQLSLSLSHYGMDYGNYQG